MFMSFKLRRWVKSYLEPRLKPHWFIRQINTFIASRKNGVWTIYVEIANSENEQEWTNAFMKFDSFGICIKEDFTGDTWKKEDKIDLLLKALGYIYIPESNVSIPAHLEKIKK